MKTNLKERNMKKIILMITCFFVFNSVYANEVIQKKEASVANIVQPFKNAVKTDNPSLIADYVSYPFERQNPLPDIENKEDFVQNYEYIFDDKLKKSIVESLPDDWEKMGWRGIMFDNGILWLDDNGKLIAINNETKKETDYIKQWYEKDKKILYPSLRKYEKHILVFKTDKRLGRIDRVAENSYRLALWDKDDTFSKKPKIIISDGSVKFHGTANNTTYHFNLGDTSYVFYVNRIRALEQPQYEFSETKNGMGENFTKVEAHIVKE